MNLTLNLTVLKNKLIFKILLVCFLLPLGFFFSGCTHSRPAAYQLRQNAPKTQTSTQATPAPNSSGKKTKSSSTNPDVRAPIDNKPVISASASVQNSLSTIVSFDETKTYDVDAKVIGAILPLTGKNANIGQHALNALRMGLGIASPDAPTTTPNASRSENNFRLAVFDSESNPELAAKGAVKLVIEDKAIALLGGFTAKEALAIASRAEALRTPYIGFSQKSGLTSLGNYIFRNSITPEMQVDRLVQFAFDKLSAKKFAILFPNDSYGVEFSSIFWDHVLARGGEITAAQTYDPKENDFSVVTQKLIGTYYIEARADEYKDRLKEIKAKEKAKEKIRAKTAATKSPIKKNSREHAFEENILTPIIDFDVLFVPDSSRALSQIMAFMKYNAAEELTYLGTNLWNSPDLPKRVTNQLASVYFVDAIDLSEGTATDDGSPAVPNDFFRDYLGLHGEEPTLVEIQAYESAKIIKDLILSGDTTRTALADSLRSLGRSTGVTGELRMSSNRELERPIRILTLNSGFVKKAE
ncbi:MAG: penicillin-binding protein activator [Bdellovibrionota bacterium]